MINYEIMNYKNIKQKQYIIKQLQKKETYYAPLWHEMLNIREMQQQPKTSICMYTQTKMKKHFFCNIDCCEMIWKQYILTFKATC